MLPCAPSNNNNQRNVLTRLLTGQPGWRGRGAESGRSGDFSFATSSRPAVGPTQLANEWVPAVQSPHGTETSSGEGWTVNKQRDNRKATSPRLFLSRPWVRTLTVNTSWACTLWGLQTKSLVCQLPRDCEIVLHSELVN
jgi:hypothetical protein